MRRLDPSYSHSPGSGLLFWSGRRRTPRVPDKPDKPGRARRCPSGSRKAPRVDGYYRQDGRWAARKPQHAADAAPTAHLERRVLRVDARDGR